MILSGFLAYAQQPGQSPQPAQGSFLSPLLMFALIFVIFYVLIILPSRKKQKRHLQMVENLKPGDKIITTGGIFGTVMGIQKDRIELKIAANVKIEITKNSVGGILGSGGDKTK
ncbi:MAG: preprotein translocase subunit YajC [Candidatus Aminicenantales bacterium]